MRHVPRGMMRYSMALQVPTVSLDGLNQLDEAWTTVAVLACHAEQMQTADAFGDGGPEIRTDWKILAAWHPLATTRCRLLWNDNGVSRAFNIRGCWDRDGRKRTLEIDATEIQS